MNVILATDPRALLSGVEYAGGRGDWDAAHPGKPAPSFDSAQPKLNGALSMRKWALNPPPAGDFTYQALMPDGTMKSFTLPGAILGAPNFPGQATTVESYDAWLARQPEPEIFYRDTGARNFSSGMKFFALAPEDEAWIVNDLRAAGIDVEVLPDDGAYRYGEGYAPRVTYAKVNGTAAAISLGHFFKIRSAKGVGANGQWVIPDRGQPPTFSPDLRFTATALDEWPVPNVIPAGYKPGKTTSGLATIAAFVQVEAGPAPGVPGASTDLTPVISRLDQIRGDIRQLAEAQGVRLP